MPLVHFVVNRFGSDTWLGELLQQPLAEREGGRLDPVRMRPHPYEFMLYFDI